jgi:two-component system chemotaxis response regulator CheY
MSIHPSMSILVVDDFETMTSIVRSLLRKLGLSNVDAVFDGKSALRELHKRHYDLVISDWNMASMSGYDLLKEVRADPKLASIPFILITGSCTAEAVLAAKAAGVNDYIIKPFTAETLRRKLNAVFAAPLAHDVVSK